LYPSRGPTLEAGEKFERGADAKANPGRLPALANKRTDQLALRRSYREEMYTCRTAFDELCDLNLRLRIMKNAAGGRVVEEPQVRVLGRQIVQQTRIASDDSRALQIPIAKEASG